MAAQVTLQDFKDFVRLIEIAAQRNAFGIDEYGTVHAAHAKMKAFIDASMSQDATSQVPPDAGSPGAGPNTDVQANVQP